MRRPLRTALLGALVWATTQGAIASTESPSPSGGIAQLEALLLLAENRPQEARAALGHWPEGDSPQHRREALLFKAWVVGRMDSQVAELDQARTDLVAASQAISPKLAQADDHLIKALKIERAGTTADQSARLALEGYEAWCGSQSPPQPDCSYRERWRAHMVMVQIAGKQQAAGAAREHAMAALELATAGRDQRRQAISENQLANTAAEAGAIDLATQHLARARQWAGSNPDKALQLRLIYTESMVAWARKQPQQSMAALRKALALAQQIGSVRNQAAILANLSDQAVKAGLPRQALDAAEQGLALISGRPTESVHRTLTNNALLARVALGHSAQARMDFETLQKELETLGATGVQLSSIREFGDALAAVGDHKGALEMHHRERAVAERLMAANREAALAELRTRYDREAQQRRILLLERDNNVQSATLVNQALKQRLWAVAGAVLALAAALLLVLARRVRETQRKLVDSQAQLKVQSERDALTGLYSRRHAQTLLKLADLPEAGFTGTLLMIDIDHFKQINDVHGHSAGDQVIAEVARRLLAHAGADAMVARWGGEEFIVHAPSLDRTQSDTLARDLLHAVGGEPITVRSSTEHSAKPLALRVTVSVGRGWFPLPPHQVPLSVDQAINLADMALYTAKGQGRHRAVGIVACTASQPDDLRAVETDFERAWEAGRVTLHVDLGPGPSLDGSPQGHTVASVTRPAAETALP
jgi:diguanylate cyclase (GGDEF)-like protein